MDDTHAVDSATVDPGSLPMFQNLADVQPEALEWIWEGLIPRGKLTVVTGDAGSGKSLFALQVVAMVSQGVQRPLMEELTADGMRSIEAIKAAAPGTALLLVAEDGLTDTVRPRLESAGADLARTLILRMDRAGGNEDSLAGASRTEAPAEATEEQKRSGFQLDRDLEVLESQVIGLKASGVDLRLIVIDPIEHFLNVTQRDFELTRFANRLAELAARCRVAVLVVANSGLSRIARHGCRGAVIGLDPLAKAARSVLMIATDLENDLERLVLSVKSNLARRAAGVAFYLRNGVVHWKRQPLSYTCSDYFARSRDKLRNPLIREECSEIDRVTSWLQSRLSKGNNASVLIREDAYDNEIAYGTLRQAFRRLGCRTAKSPSDGRWYWRLPGDLCCSTAWMYRDVVPNGDPWLKAEVAEMIHQQYVLPACQKAD